MTEAKDTPLLVVYDGTALLFRSYFGMSKSKVTSPTGVPVGGVLGVGQRLAQMMKRLRPRHAAVVFDAGKLTFRNDLDPQYKANRGEPPEDLIPQFDLVKEMVASLGFACFCEHGFEADDLMATLVRLAREAGMATQLVSVDKDICQLVSDEHPAVFMYDPKQTQFINEAGVHNRLGVKPSQVTNYFALLGDSSDNVPGVKGVGPKTAQILIEKFGTLENIYANLHEVGQLPVRRSKSLVQTLEQGKPNAWLARTLVTLRKDVPIGIEARQLRDVTRWRGPLADADQIFDDLGFHRPLASLHQLAREYKEEL